MVVGAGPAGLYAALVLGTNGVAVDLIDRGAELKQRGTDVVRFHRTRMPNPESNLLFGEGGAGTYSDGKLYTRVDDPLEVPCLEELVACGAPPEPGTVNRPVRVAGCRQKPDENTIVSSSPQSAVG